jgi:regulator of cell morphogenesis and NO signaling
MNEITSLSLAQIVNKDHRAASIFEKYHLDFCKGKRTLQQACDESDLEINQVVLELENVLGNEKSYELDLTACSLSQIIQYILQTHHSYVKKEMPVILAYLQKVAAKHGSGHPEMLKVFELFDAVNEELDLHMKKEELILFPRIVELEQLAATGKTININQTYIQSPITIMEQEHDHAGKLMEEIRELTQNYTPPPDACTTYRLSFAALQAFETDLHRHVHAENYILFPKALQLFGIPGEYSLN